MFSIGEKILYPMHGAGTIKSIERRTILGLEKEYYVLSLPFDNVDVMVPVDNAEKIGVRNIISMDEFPRILDKLSEATITIEKNWNRRLRENMELLKSGDILKVAEVVRDLVRSDRIQKLSAGEMKLLRNAKQVLESELAMVKNMELSLVDNLVEDAI